MATTNFVDNVTKIVAAWANEVDAIVHDVFSAATTKAQARANLGVSFRGALLKRSDDFPVATSTLGAVPWDEEIYDTDSFHDLVTNPTRITIPASVTWVRFGMMCQWDTNATGFRTLLIAKNGNTTDTVIGSARVIEAPGNADPFIQQAFTAPLQVVAGDFFESYIFQTSGITMGMNASPAPSDSHNRNWFFVEVIE